MSKLFIIEDEMHADQQGEFKSFDEALNELEKRAKIPFDVEPNRCPCYNFKDCERRYTIILYNTITTPWKELFRKEILNISSNKVEWI